MRRWTFAWWWGIAIVLFAAGMTWGQTTLARKTLSTTWQTSAVKTIPIAAETFGIEFTNADSDSSAEVWAYRGSAVLHDTTVVQPEWTQFLPWRLAPGDSMGSRLVAAGTSKLSVMLFQVRD